MPSNAIQIENLGKMYHLGLTHAGSIRELVDRWTRRLLRRPLEEDLADEKEFWALRNVDAEIKEGEVVGVIGRNGAGKSTLLKILSRITKPTEGRAEIVGRVGSLLEVGTGFHPELTGRENIFMNGAILGMARVEIRRKFDEIVEFSEIGRFIDTPVKRYSSGMYVRLAFAVAAHLEPEVLIVDEVLAVGDSAFQKKCLGKMESVGKSGRTVLFVSHNLGSVKSLCSRAVLLDSGQIVADGESGDIVDAYLQHGAEIGNNGIVPDNAPRFGTGEARVRKVTLANLGGTTVDELFLGQPFCVSFEFEVFTEVRDAHFEININTFDGIQLCVSHNELEHLPSRLSAGTHLVTAEFDVVLMPRSYTIGVNIYRTNGNSIDYVERTYDFEVSRNAESESGHYRWLKVRGYVRPRAKWQAFDGQRLIPREPIFGEP